ncbi:MAG: hypothetical protein ACRDRW_08105 [Pseudonocardiaceae bacterium]
MTRRATGLDWALATLDRYLVHAVVGAIDRARDVNPASNRDLPRGLELARDLAQELEHARDLAWELEHARAGNASELASALTLVRALELALTRDLEPARPAVLDTERVSALDHELELEHDLHVAFVRAPAFVRALTKARVLNGVRALVRALVCARAFVAPSKVATIKGERAFGRGARVVLSPAMGVLMALAVQVLPASRQLRHLEEFCAELIELRWWQWPWHVLCILGTMGGLRRALNEAASTPDGAQARRAKR